MREGVTEAVSKEGKPYKYDISIPLNTFKQVVDQTRDRLRGVEGVKAVLGYGHVGDGLFFLPLLSGFPCLPIGIKVTST